MIEKQWYKVGGYSFCITVDSIPNLLETLTNCHPFRISEEEAKSTDTPIRDKIAISCMLRQIHESSSHAIRHGLYIKNRKRLFCP